VTYRQTILVFVLLTALAVPAQPQSSTGRVSGTVLDQSGAIVPGARVALTHTATNVVSRTLSNESGVFVFPGVSPGAYRLTAEVAGMEQFEARLTVQVQQAVTVDPVMRVGQAASAVTIQDVTPLINAEAPALGHVLERARIEQLPQNGRYLWSLGQTVPGVQGFYPRAYGLRVSANETLIDGAVTTDRRWNRYGDWIGLDAVEEFKVETNGSSAKFSRPMNMVVSTRGGTNQFHGTAFETHRNSAFGTARQRQDIWSKAPFLNRAEYGASAGGPVEIPKVYHGRNRTFWFFAWEGARRRSPVTGLFRVPTEAMRQGDFSNLRDGQGRLLTLYDPWTTTTQNWQRQPFAHGGKLNAIDPSRLSPVAKYFFSITPTPTYPEVNPVIDNNLYLQAPNSLNKYTTTVRLDHKFTDNDRIFWRYTRGVETNTQVPGGITVVTLGSALTDPNIGLYTTVEPTQSMVISYTRLFSPTFFNELMVTGSKQLSESPYGTIGDWTGKLGLPNPFGAPIFPVLSGMGLDRYGAGGGNLFVDRQSTLTLNDNATKVHGKHEIQFGGQVRLDQQARRGNSAGMSGTVSYNTLATALYDPRTPANNPGATPQTGYDLANFYLGVANFSTTFRAPNFYPRWEEYSLYLQDNFKVTPRLTLNLGLRWEYFSNMSDKAGMLNSFEPVKRAGVIESDLDEYYRRGATLPSIVRTLEGHGAKWLSSDQAGLPRSMVDGNWLNFGPRLGVAYRLSTGARPTVVRGGYRVSYSGSLNNYFQNQYVTSAPLSATFSNSLNDAARTPDGIASYGMRSVPRIIAGVNSANAIDLNNPQGLARGAASFWYNNRSQPNMQVQDWNVTFEKEFLPDMVARFGYIGNHSSNVPQWYSYNDAPSAYVWFATTGLPLPTGEFANVARRNYDQRSYGALNELRRSGYTNYNGVLLELERRFSKGAAFHIFYHINNALATGSQSAPAASQPVPEMNMFLPSLGVPTDYDQRNRLLNYQRDASIPKHNIRWNWVADLPFGKGKLVGRNAGGFLDRVIGGWQVAGLGSLNTNYFALPTNIFPNGEKIELYGYRYPIEDCRSGRCFPGYLWWNGYIPANQINSVDPATGRPNGVMGVPADYKPAGQPLIPWPANPNRNDPNYAFFGTNTVWLRLNDGTEQRTAYDPGMHVWQNQFLPGVLQWGLDASLFKRVAITERVFVRVNFDFFNVLNRPNNPNSIGGDGVLQTRNSGSGARQLQFTLRVTW
jgi:hypothetical protein